MDFSLTTLFVVPVGNTIPTTGSTQDLTAGQVGIYNSDYTPYVGSGTSPYIYIAQGRTNTYLQATKRSDKIPTTAINWYKVTGSSVARTEIHQVGSFNVKGGEVVTLTLRAHSSYIDTLYFNGFTRSVTVQAPCLACGGDPCGAVDVPTLIDSLIVKLTQAAPGINPDNISFNTFYSFARIGTGSTATLQITSKPLTKYGQPCDVAAFPYEYDRMWFRAFVYKGPATTADFIVADACDIAAVDTITQRSSYPTGSSDEIKQLEKDYYSYQAAYLKDLVRMGGYNYNFESWVTDGTTYDTYVIKYKPYGENISWVASLHEDATVIMAIPHALASAWETLLVDYLGAVTDYSSPSNSTTTTTSTTGAPTTTTTTSTLIP